MELAGVLGGTRILRNLLEFWRTRLLLELGGVSVDLFKNCVEFLKNILGD